jgi:hypothetical protein
MARYRNPLRKGLLAGAIGLGLLGAALSAQSPMPAQPQPPASATPAQGTAQQRPDTTAGGPGTPAATSAPVATGSPSTPAGGTSATTAVPAATAIPTAASAPTSHATPTSAAATGAAASVAGAAPPQVQGTPPFLAGISVDHADGVYRQGELLRLNCRAERDAHLYVLYRQANGETALIFPNGLQPDNRVKAKTPVELPPPGDVVYRVQPPLGDELLQVLAVEKPLLELQGLVRDKGRAVIVPKPVLEALHRHLEQNRKTWTEHHVEIRTVARDAQPPRPPKRVGLFVGLAEYAEADLLKPSVELGNSATVMHDLMLQIGKLDPQATRLLRDKQAGKAEIRKAIAEWLPSVSQPGDTVFVYFSGRASRLPTNDPGETDGFDEVIFPYDMSHGAANAAADVQLKTRRERSIVDDELAYWLQSLGGRQVVLILDTSHGGGVVEGKSLSAWFDGESQRVKDISQTNVVVLSSCLTDEQTRLESAPNKTLWFTHCLAEAMRNRPDGRPLTLANGYRMARVKMFELFSQGSPALDQEPTLVDRTLLPVFLVP